MRFGTGDPLAAERTGARHAAEATVSAMPIAPHIRDRAVPFDEAAGVVSAMLGPVVQTGRRAVVGIGGPVASGKTTLARVLSACVVSTDDYLPDYDAIPMDERDLPHHAHLDELARHLRALRDLGRAEVPVWSFDTHRREGRRAVEAAPVIVCEGIHALHETVRPALDVLVYVHADRPQRLKRFEDRERAGERGWTVEHAREHFERIAEPTFDRFARAYLDAADVVVINPWSEGAS